MQTVYKIENLINGFVYVGQTKNFKKRTRSHKKSSKYESSTSYKYKLYVDARKFGWENFVFEIICECPKEEADAIEEYWINYYMDKSISYNNTRYAKAAHDPDIINFCRDIRIKINHGKRKRVEQYDKKGNLLATYEGVREAGRITGLSHHTIQKVANGDKHRKTGGGYVWKYCDK